MVLKKEIPNYSLEDIYTPIDKSIIESTSFRDHTPKQLLDLREKINKLVIVALRTEIESNTDKKKTIDKFARYIVNCCKQRIDNEELDTVSIITTNWDIILDNHIFNVINEDPIPSGHKFSGVLDYCCYISSLEEDDEKIKPGLYALGKGRYNVKLLKLHGSLNWLQCPKCSRLFVKLYKSFNGGYVISKKYCRHCEKNYDLKEDITNQLYTNLITPTFLKNLNNVQNKLVWQNAAIELSEADKIVFVQSIVMAACCVMLPAVILPGHFTKAGTLMPPSHNVPFAFASPPLSEYRSPPLSFVKITIVLFDNFSSSRVFIILPTASSRLLVMAA